MAKIMKVRCNGPGQHLNEVNPDKLITPCFVFHKSAPCAGLPKRLVLDCKECEEGKVIITPAMLREKFESE